MAASADFALLLKIWLFSAVFSTFEASKFCLEGYFCERGHCCGHGRCCTYYYELWWFWVACVLVALMGTCWYFHHKRWKRRNMEERQRRTTVTSDISTQATAQNPSKVFQLPSYDESQGMPKEPPPYRQENIHLAVVAGSHFAQGSGAGGCAQSPPLYSPGTEEPSSEPPQYSIEDTARLISETHYSVDEGEFASNSQPDQMDILDATASTSLLRHEERIAE